MENMNNDLFNADGTPTDKMRKIMELAKHKREAEEDRSAVDTLTREIEQPSDGYRKVFEIVKRSFATAEDTYADRAFRVDRYTRRTFEGAVKALEDEIADAFDLTGTNLKPSDPMGILDAREGLSLEEGSSWCWADDRSMGWNDRIPFLRIISNGNESAEFYLFTKFVPKFEKI